MALPFEAGVVKLTVAWLLPGAPGVAVTFAGAPGTVVGITGLEALTGLVPILFVAVTMNS
jgi:hypothetical protein